MPRPATWQLASPPPLWRSWPGEGDCVSFLESTGDLHLLTASATVVLDRLASGPATVTDLADVLKLDAESIVSALRSMETLGLVTFEP
jgi:DNA-binding MarR family transcriptional regulator